MESKFEIKSPDKKPTAESEPRSPRLRESEVGLGREEKEPEPQPEIQTWEGEGGSVEEAEESPAEMPETVVEEEKVKTAWQELIAQAKEEFPERIKQFIDKASRDEKLDSNEISAFDTFAYKWFRETFGILKKKKQLTKEEPAEEQRVLKAERQKRIIEEKKSVKLAELKRQKRDKMEQLHRALGNLDNGEPVDEFRDETRRIVYFDEENQEYFVEEGDSRKVVGIGDIVSDYAWGIKYVPDGEIIEPAYRTVAKRILTNETRRDLETIHNIELNIQKDVYSSAIYPLSKIKTAIETKIITGKETSKEMIGGIAGLLGEIAIREFLSRVSLNNNLDFAVSRATLEEDAEFKYDFKIRIVRRVRGVSVQNSPNIKSVGFQLKTIFVRESVYVGGYKKGKKQGVDDILIIKTPGKEFLDSFKRWLNTGEPSGGPEQFLSPELKKAILKAVTEKLVDIPQEVFDKII